MEKSASKVGPLSKGLEADRSRDLIRFRSTAEYTEDMWSMGRVEDRKLAKRGWAIKP